MKKLLRNSYSKFSATLAVLTNNLFTGKKLSFVLPSLFTLLLVAGFNQQSQAQTMYYLGSDGTSNTNNANDAIFKINQDGTGKIRVVDGVSAPQDMVLDLPNNRAFVTSQSFAGSTTATPHGLYKIDLSTGAKVRLVIADDSFRISSLAYDPLTDYIYFTSNDGNGTTGTVIVANDALNRIKSDGTGRTVLASGISPAPRYVALDIPNNKIYVYDPVVSAPKLMTFNLGTNSATLASTFNTVVFNGMDYDPVTNWIYYTTDNGNTSETPDDALWRMRPNGTSQTKIIGNLSPNPNIVTVERTRNIAFVWNSTGGDRRIVKVDIAAGTKSAFPVTPAFNISNMLAAIVIPPASKVATLSAFTISSGTLAPGFSSGTTSYTASVPYNVSSITVTPTKTDNFASITVNNTTVASGSASGGISLNYGDNVITTVVTAEDGLTTKTYTLTVNRARAPQTITFASTATKTYGAADFAPGATASSGLGVSYSSDNTNVATIVSGQIHIVGAGTANITASQSGDGNTLAASNVVQALTVNKASQTITFAGTATKTYGNTDYAPGATTNSGLTVSYSSDNASVATIVSNQVHIVGQGTANITASQAGDGNRLAATSVVQSLTVGKATVTVTAAAKTKVYGDTDPALTFTATGVVGSDAPTGALTRATGTTIGDYTISQGSLTYGNNYNLTFVAANLTITKRPLTIAPLPVTKVYGTNDFANGAPYSFNGTSIAPGEGMTGLFGRDNTSENVGVYALTKGVKRPVNVNNGDDMSANYNITFITNTFTITAKPITVSATAQTKTYGAADPELTYSNSGLAFSDTFTGALTRSAGENLGTYAISQGSLLAGSNYTLSFTANNLTIAKKIVNVTANAKTKTYGDVDPVFDYTADALSFSDSFTGSLSRNAGETAGTYAINQGSLALNSNYTLNYTGNNLTIGTKTINVTANAATKTYGEADPALTYNADALVSGDAFTGSITRTAGELAGSYPITQGSLALTSNYALNYTGANLTIGKRDVTINAFAQNVPYGDADPTIGYNTTGSALATGDAITGALSRAPGTAIGTYAITQNTLTVSNSNSYNIIFNSAAFNITARPITITSPFKVKVYGDADPALTYSVTAGSLLPGDELTGSLVRNAGENSGSYSVHQGTVTVNNPNYNVTYNLFNFEIDRAPLTIKADDKTKLLNAPNPTFTYIITGFKNGDNESAFTSPIMFQNLPLSSAPVGTYSIDFANAGAVNYDLTQQSGVLTVREAAANADLASLSVAEGAITPTFDPATTTYSLSVGAGVTQVNVTGVLADANAKLFRISGFNATSGQANTVYVYPGDNQISVLVTAEDNTTSKEYIINVSKPLDTNAKLSGLYLTYNDSFVSVPNFDPEVHAYTVNVSNDVTSLRLSPYAAGASAFTKINGDPYEGYFATGLTPGDNNFSFEVFAQDRTVSETYTLNIIRAISSNNKLSNITLSTGTLAPTFNKDVLNYTASVTSNVYSVDVQGFVSDTTAMYKVNGNVLTDRHQPYTVALTGGQNKITLQVTAKNGDVREYVVVVTKVLSTNATLTNLTLNSGQLIPVFAPDVTEYDQTIPYARTSVNIAATAETAGTTISINGTPFISGNNINIPMIVGTNNVYVVSTAEDGSTIKTYTLNINRIGSGDVSFSSVAITTGAIFKHTGNTFTTSVNPTTSSVKLKLTLADTNSRMTINGIATTSGAESASVALIGASTNINVVVTGQDGVTTRAYTITVTKDGSTNVSLASILINPNSTLTLSGNNFTTSVSSSLTSVKLKVNTADANATVQINGDLTPDGTESAPIALTSSSTLINVVVVAEDKVSTRNYTVTVNKGGSSNAGLASIISNPSAAFKLSGTTFSTSVSASITSIKFKVALADVNATLKINGNAVLSGEESAPITLSGQITVANINILAEDGVTSRNYTVTVNKNGSSNANLASVILNPTSSLVLSGTNFSTSVSSSLSSVRVKVSLADVTAVLKINGTITSSGEESVPVTLNGQSTVINISTIAEDGLTSRDYTITVNKSGSSNASLASIITNPASKLTLVGNDYSTSVSPLSNSIKLKVNTADNNAIIRINGTITATGNESTLISLTAHTTVINIVVNAEDGITSRSYTVTVSKNGSNNANLASIALNPASPLVLIDDNFNTSISASVTIVKVKATLSDQDAQLRINGALTTSGVDTEPITLTPGINVINISITAQDGTTTRKYTITVNKPIPNNLLAVTKTGANMLANRSNSFSAFDKDNVVVHQGVSPNGDGFNDFLVVEGLSSITGNKISIMNSSGTLVFDMKDYGKDGSRVFDGHAKSGKLLNAGTYYYVLDYKETDGKDKRKSGYIILKY